MASTSTSKSSPMLVPRGALEGKPSIPIHRPIWIIGSRKGCHLNLVSGSISQAHAVIVNTGQGLFIKDLASRTHTYVNRVPIREVPLSDGDKIQVGNFKFYFRDPTGARTDAPAAQPAALRVPSEPIPVPLDTRVTFIGRRAGADIMLTEESVSTMHALIVDMGGEHHIRDLGSRTGTFVNGEKIDHQAVLNFGDVVKIGDTEMTFQAADVPHEEEEASAVEDAAAASAIALELDEPAADNAEPVNVDDVLGLTPDTESEVSATATPVSDPIDLAEIEPPTMEAAPPAEAPEEPAPSARRGWRQWGTKQPAKTPPPKAEAPAPAPPEIESPEPPALDIAPPPASEPLELSGPLTSEPPDVTPEAAPDAGALDLSEFVEPEAAAEPELPLQLDEADSSDTAYAVDLPPTAAKDDAAAEAARDEVTASELELSSTDDGAAHVLDLEAAAEPEPQGDDKGVFDGVNLDDLALEALNEPAVDAPATPDVSATSDISLAEPETPIEEVAAPLELPAVEDDALPPEPPALDELDLSAEEKVDHPPVVEDDIAPLESPPAEELPAEELKVEDELPLTPPSPAPAAPVAPTAPAAKTGDDLPPPLEKEIRIKPAGRRKKRGGDTGEVPKRRGPMRGKGGRFMSAAEFEEQQEEAADTAQQADSAEPQVEVLDETEPTPESALNLEPVADADAAPEMPLPADEAPPSDSVFGREVEDMAGSALGNLIEPQSEDAARTLSPLEQIAADATHFVDTDTPAEIEATEPAEELSATHHEITEPEVPGAQDEVAAGELELSEPAEEPHALDLTADADVAPLELPASAEEPDIAEPEEIAELDLSVAPEEPAEAAPQPEAEVPLELPEAADLEVPSIDDTADEKSFEETFEDTGSTSLAGEAVPAEPSATDSDHVEPSAEALAPEAPAAPPARRQPASPGDLGAYGITRDVDTFLGGMPLSLPPLPPPPSSFGKVGVSFGDQQSRGPAKAPLPPPLAIGDEDDTPVTAADLDGTNDTAEDAPATDVSASATPVTEPTAGGNDTTIMPALPVQEQQAPKIPVPPRPRRNRLADYEQRFAKVDEDKALEEMLRQQNQPKAETPGASGFDGLTLGPAVRQTDVFSQMPSSAPPIGPVAPGDAFAAEKEVSIDTAARHVPAGRVPPVAPVPAVPLGEASDAVVPDLADPLSTDPFGMNGAETAKAAKQPPRRVTTAPPPNFNYTGPTRGSRKIPIRALVAAMVVFMVGAGVASFMLTPVYTLLHARATFQNLKERSVFEQSRFRTEQQALLTSEVVRTQARAILNEQDPKLDPGLLAAPVAFDEMARKLDWPSNSNLMVLKLKSADPEGDKQRLAALLKAIHNENKHLIDVSAQNQQKFEEAQAELDQLNNQLKDLMARIRAFQDDAGDAPGPNLITQVELEAGQLSDQWQATVARVKQLKVDLERLTPEGGNPATQPAAAAPVIEVAGGDPDKDPVVIQLREELKALQDQINRAKAINSEDAASNARKALDDALNVYQEELNKVAEGKNADWEPLIAAARKLQGMATQVTGDIINRQREEHAKLMEMKRKLEQEQVDRREKLYGDDEQLKKLNDQYRLARRQFNAADSNGLAAEAARFKTEMAETEAAIEARKQQLGQDETLAKKIAEVEELIKSTARSIDGDRRTLDAQMDDAMNDFQRAGAELVKKLQPNEQKVAEGLNRRAIMLVDARRTYGDLVNSVKGDTTHLQKLEADAQLVSARIDRRVAEVQDAERRNKSELERAALAKKIEDTRAALAGAEKEETEAGKKWLAKQQELAELRAKAAQAKVSDQKFQEAKAQRQQLQNVINQKVAELDKRKVGTASIVPEKPADDAITEVSREDARWKYALISSMGVCGLFLVLIWLGGYHYTPTSGPHRPAIETVTPAKEGGAAGDEETVTV